MGFLIGLIHLIHTAYFTRPAGAISDASAHVIMGTLRRVTCLKQRVHVRSGEKLSMARLIAKRSFSKHINVTTTRHDQYPPQVTDEECDFRNDDPVSEQVLHNTSTVLINPLENADHNQESNTVLLNGAAGPIRIGAETLDSVPYVMHNSDNDDEENKTKNPRPSNTVPNKSIK